MKRLLIAIALTTAACMPAMAALKAGEHAPPFTAPASLAGQRYTYSLADALKRGPVVVYFYPAAFTRGCSLQAHAFAVQRDEFAAAGATIVGVSLDDIDSLQAFSADPESCAGRIAVASDPDGRIARSYAIDVRHAEPGRKDRRGRDIDHGLAERTTFVIQPDGKVAEVIGGVDPAANVEQALKAVRRVGAMTKR